MMLGILLSCSKSFVTTLTDTDRLASAHHVSVIDISPVKPRTTGAAWSTITAGRRLFDVSTRHVPWDCTPASSSLGALVRCTAEKNNLSFDEQHLRRLSQPARWHRMISKAQVWGVWSDCRPEC